MEITLKGRIPSKKNQKQIVFAKGRPIIVSSKKHKEWQEEQMWVVKGKGKVEEVKNIDITLYAPDRRKGDLTNKAESIMDLLVDAGIIEDDNWTIVPNVYLRFGGVDKENPRAVITINKE